MRHFIEFIRKESTEFRKPLIVAIIVAGIINGIGVTVAVHAVGSLKPGEVNPKTFFLFMGCIVGYWFSKELVLNRTTTILEEIIERIRLRILGKIRDTDLLPYESMDKGRIYATLSSDAVNISTSAGMVINASSSLVMLVFTIGLIASISMNALFITVGLIAIVLIYYMKRSRYVTRQMALASHRENDFFDNLNGFLNGFKELKLNRDKRNDYFTNELQTVIHATNLHRVDAGKAMNHSLLIAHTYLFFTLAGLLFAMPILSPGETSIIPMLVPVILFASGPFADVVSSIPALVKAEASIVNIYKLEESIDQRVGESSAARELEIDTSQPLSFSRLSCTNLSFQYPSPGQHPFKVQPVDFEIKSGEIVFIVGGNGSGKSTFLKMITGLYLPDTGSISLNDEEIGPDNVAKLREIFSPIFTDFHLFKRILGRQPDDPERIGELLRRMELADKTAFVNGKITNLNLSTGQRKRMALIMSTLDERPVHIFDEWAADQDPVFRKFFYDVLLRRMVSEGKTIIAVTHDDHYFHVADRVYRMEYGNFLPYSPPGKLS